MLLPHLIYLKNNGCLHFDQETLQIEEIYRQDDVVDVWSVDDESMYRQILYLQRVYIKANLLHTIKTPKTKDLKIGTQVAYLPQHVKIADMLNPDIQFGFVTSVKKNIVYVRYYSQYDARTLRTLSCSERSPVENIYLLKTMDTEIVNGWIKYIEEENRTHGVVMDDIFKRLGAKP